MRTEGNLGERFQASLCLRIMWAEKALDFMLRIPTPCIRNVRLRVAATCEPEFPMLVAGTLTVATVPPTASMHRGHGTRVVSFASHSGLESSLRFLCTTRGLRATPIVVQTLR